MEVEKKTARLKVTTNMLSDQYVGKVKYIVEMIEEKVEMIEEKGNLERRQLTLYLHPSALSLTKILNKIPQL